MGGNVPAGVGCGVLARAAEGRADLSTGLSPEAGETGIGAALGAFFRYSDRVNDGL